MRDERATMRAEGQDERAQGLKTLERVFDVQSKLRVGTDAAMKTTTIGEDRRAVSC